MALRSSLSSCSHILKTEVIRSVPRLCKLELYTVGVESLAGDHGHAVVSFISIYFSSICVTCSTVSVRLLVVIVIPSVPSI